MGILMHHRRDPNRGTPQARLYVLCVDLMGPPELNSRDHKRASDSDESDTIVAHRSRSEGDPANDAGSAGSTDQLSRRQGPVCLANPIRSQGCAHQGHGRPTNHQTGTGPQQHVTQPDDRGEEDRRADNGNGATDQSELQAG